MKKQKTHTTFHVKKGKTKGGVTSWKGLGIKTRHTKKFSWAVFLGAKKMPRRKRGIRFMF